MKKFLWAMFAFALFFVSGCSGSPASDAEGNTFVPSNDEGNNGEGGGSEISIPSYSQSAPSGFLDQLAWAGGGGDKAGSCVSCQAYVLADQVILSGFNADQIVVLLFYRIADLDSCGNRTADFVASYAVRVNASGNMQLSITGMTEDIFLYGAFDDQTQEMLVGMPLGGKYPC